MKILISADMEGVSSVTTWRHVLPERGAGEFERVRRYWMGDINSAIEGCLNISADIQFLVTEAHYEMTYIIPDMLHPNAQHISGFFKKDMHLAGIDSSFDGVILFTHPMAGASTNGVLSHSLVPTIQNLYLNNQLVGELQMNTALAGWYKVPVIMVVGDQEIAKEAELIFGSDFPVAITKVGLDRFAAKCLTPLNSQKLIRSTAEKAIKYIEDRKVWLPQSPFELVIEFQGSTMATACSLIPGIELVGSRTIRVKSENYQFLYNLAHLCALISVSRFINDDTV